MRKISTSREHLSSFRNCVMVAKDDNGEDDERILRLFVQVKGGCSVKRRYTGSFLSLYFTPFGRQETRNVVIGAQHLGSTSVDMKEDYAIRPQVTHVSHKGVSGSKEVFFFLNMLSETETPLDSFHRTIGIRDTNNRILKSSNPRRSPVFL